MKAGFSILVALGAMLLFTAGATRSVGAESGGRILFVGTTPCGMLAREFLGISKSEQCDKVAWELGLPADGKDGVCHLSATFGLQEQSAPGFVAGGKRVQFEALVEVRRGVRSRPDGAVFFIRRQPSGPGISLLRVNENLLHLLAENGTLLIGNEFWSYTLNRKEVGKDK